MGYFKGKKVLVTGGSGFIASHLCRRLIKEGADVSILTKYNSIIDNIRLANMWGRINVIEADLRNPDSLQQIRALKPHIVYHFAAYNHVGDSFTHITEAIDVNGRGTANLFGAYSGYKKFIYISSSEIYGYQKAFPFSEDMTPFPVSPYAVGKYSGELYARMQRHVFNKPIVVLRPFNAFGPYQSPRAIIAELIIKCLKGEDIVTTKGVQTRDFNYVENLVNGFILAGQNDRALGEIINLGSGREISISTLVKEVHKLTDSKSRLYIGKLPYRPTEIWRMAADNRKAKKILKWESFIDFKEGLSDTIRWYRKFNEIFLDSGSDLRNL